MKKTKCTFAEGLVLSGFVRSLKGKDKARPKIMEFETRTGIHTLRLPKDLRRFAGSELECDSQVRVWLSPSAKKPTVAFFVPLKPKAIVGRYHCLEVCSSSSCCRRGSQELLRQLRKGLADRFEGNSEDLYSGDGVQVEVAQCGCLKECRNGPNVKIDGRTCRLSLGNLSQFLDYNFPTN